MQIEWMDVKEFTQKELQDLFLSVGWSSGNYPEKLQGAMHNSHAVLTAWDGTKLVGLMNAMADGVMNVYFPYLMVRPEYQGKGIGRGLIERMLERYQGYLRMILIAYDHAVDFYQHCGFTAGEGKTPMFVTALTT